MTINTPPPIGDDEATVLAAWRALPNVEPAAALDQRILAASRKQAAMPPAGGATPSRRPRWPAVWASAAVLTLAVGVSWQLRQQHPGVASAPDSAHAPAPLAEQAAESAAAATERRQTKAVADLMQADAQMEDAEAAVTATADSAARARPVAGSAASNEAVSAAADIAPAADSAAGLAAQEPATAQPAPLPQAKREAVMPQAAPAAATASSLPLPAPAPPAREDDARTAARDAPRDAPAEPAAAPQALAADPADAAAAAILQIRELVAAGQIDAARKAAAAFAVDHPQARLPDELAWLAAPN